MINLLIDPIIGVQTPDNRQILTLPQLLAMLCSGAVDAYTGQRPHQADVWHVFTVQLGASVLARNSHIRLDSPPADPDFWKEGLLRLSDYNASAWDLFGEDVTKPAFFQHPLKDEADFETSFKAKGPKAFTPDELDILVTAKDHDLKSSRLSANEREAWMYALVTYQTTSGFLGAGNYGVVRMNGGFANRPILSLCQSLHPSRRFREEMALVLGIREELLRSSIGFKADGPVLTWLTPWDRNGHQYRLDELDPLFIEAARATRLSAREEELVAYGATTKARQIGPKSLDNGDVGDPWIPIQTDNQKKGRAALSLSENGWTPELVCDLIFEKGFELTPLQKPRSASSTLWFTGSCLVRGQGTTEGFHHLLLPLPPKFTLRLLSPPERDKLAELARQLQKDARDIEGALRTALTVLTEGGPESADFGRESVKSWVKTNLQTFRITWQENFFVTLWRCVDIGEEKTRKEWIAGLIGLAKERLQKAAQVLPLPQMRRYRAIVRSENLFSGILHNRGLIMKEEA